MTHELEEALKGTLKAAAGNAPLPEHDLLDRVAKRHRTRRRHRAALAAATALLLLAGAGVITGTIGAADGRIHPAMHPSTAPVSQFVADPVAVEKLWPRAVRTVPATLPNGRRFSPITLLDAKTLLVSTESGREQADELSTYDITTWRVTPVTRISTPPGATTFASDFTAGEGEVAWWQAYKRLGRTTVEVWAAPLAGGGARRVTAMDAGPNEDAAVSRLAISGGQVHWSMSEVTSSPPPAVYQAPLSGGGPGQKIPGTDGYQIVAWPWIGTPGRTGNEGPGDVIYRTMVNVQTGERKAAKFSDEQGTWVCGVTYCLGSLRPDTADQSSGTTLGTPGTLAQDRNGRRLATLADMNAGAPTDRDLPAYDRFTAYLAPLGPKSSRAGVMLHDLRTGKVADLGMHLGAQPGEADLVAYTSPTDPANRLFFVEDKKSYILIDLASV